MRRAARLIAVVVATLVLGGCYWSEKPLLDSSSAVRVLALGPQAMRRAGEKDLKLTVTAEPGGWYALRDRRDKREVAARLVFVPLPGQTSRLAYAYGLDELGYLYGVAIRDRGRIALSPIDCSEAAAAALADRHHAQLTPYAASGTRCRFDTGADLMQALAEIYPGDLTAMASLPALP